MNQQTRAFQRAFDKALTAIREQGQPALAPGGNCKYRAQAANGQPLKCAIGHMIPDELYKQEWDKSGGTNAETLLRTVPELWPAVFGIERMSNAEANQPYLDFAGQLQRAHDFSTASDFMGRFEARMRNLADEYGLTYSLPGEDN